MSEDNRGCGSTVAAGVVVCAIIFNWFGAGDLAGGILKGAVNIVAGVAKGLSSGSSAPTRPATQPTTTIDQRLVGSWSRPQGLSDRLDLTLQPGGVAWSLGGLQADEGLSFLQSGSKWFCEGGLLVLEDATKSRQMSRLNFSTGNVTSWREEWSGRHTLRYGFDTFGNLLVPQSDGPVIVLVRR